MLKWGNQFFFKQASSELRGVLPPSPGFLGDKSWSWPWPLCWVNLIQNQWVFGRQCHLYGGSMQRRTPETWILGEATLQIEKPTQRRPDTNQQVQDNDQLVHTPRASVALRSQSVLLSPLATVAGFNVCTWPDQREWDGRHLFLGIWLRTFAFSYWTFCGERGVILSPGHNSPPSSLGLPSSGRITLSYKVSLLSHQMPAELLVCDFA